jgi:hypothetical protein
VLVSDAVKVLQNDLTWGLLGGVVVLVPFSTAFSFCYQIEKTILLLLAVLWWKQTTMELVQDFKGYEHRMIQK